MKRQPKGAKGMVLTPAIIAAATLDAGNQSMSAAGRTKWSRADYNAAAKRSNQLWDIYEGRS